MKDYYRTLQVHNKDDLATIQAAYRRLMRKCHPDVLPPELRSDPDILQKAKDINEAFEVLSDPIKRAEYDKFLHGNCNFDPNNDYSHPSTFDRSFILVKCGQTKETFKGFLVRKSKDDEIFTLIGFSRVPEFLLPDNSSFIQRVSRRFRSRSQSLTKTDQSLEFKSLSNDVLNPEQDNSPIISMGDIQWGQYTCPACAGSIENENGTIATFIGCSNCGRVRCAGNVKANKRGRFSTCPWCGKTNKLTRSVPAGKKDHLHLQGYELHPINQGKQKRIENEKTFRKLSDGNEY